ncbi:glycosyltransferase family 2 protein [uncultured Shimia sp.]|uniref:glycosyltransferase family 2 protein n=1 Tax=uncultured Shimia sp. TaxID=573152 RepID=UPI0025F85337|nr:glycosyltransferase family 2 protein [uncultured Shimia sp.]
MTKFSIITVVWNDCVGATRTMQSVFSQTYQNYEVIVQDGASTDGTSEMLRSFGNWIDSLVIEEDDGIYDAMNRATMRATGDYLVFMNAADYFINPKVLEDVAAAINPDEDDIFTGQAFRDEDGGLHRYRPLEQFWAGSTLDHQASFIRRELMQDLKYDERYKIAGDLHFFTRARLQGARYRSEDLPIVRKPFSVGASTSFVDRINDRLSMLDEAWGDSYPVRDTITKEMRHYAAKTFDVSVDRFADMPIEEMLKLFETWEKRLQALAA